MGASAAERGLKERLLAGIKRLSVIFLYLWVLLALFDLHESFVLAKYQLSYRNQSFAFINAWVLAKVMLVAEDLNLGSNWFRGRPLVYEILIKAILFATLFVCVKITEGILLGLWQGKSVAESIPRMGGGSLADVLSLGLILSVALIPFFAFKAIDRALGIGTLRALLLSSRARDSSHQQGR